MNAIKRYRKLQKMTQAQLAERLGIRQASVSVIEKNGTTDLLTAQRYATALNCNPLELLDISTLNRKDTTP